MLFISPDYFKLLGFSTIRLRGTCASCHEMIRCFPFCPPEAPTSVTHFHPVILFIYWFGNAINIVLWMLYLCKHMWIIIFVWSLQWHTLQLLNSVKWFCLFYLFKEKNYGIFIINMGKHMLALKGGNIIASGHILQVFYIGYPPKINLAIILIPKSDMASTKIYPNSLEMLQNSF